MNRTVPFVLAGLLAVAGCGGDEEPAAMPTPEDSLSTSSPDDDAATSTAPVEDDTDGTSSPPDEVEETTTPDAADIHEDSEAGAEAFARHYIDLINQTGMEPEEGALEPLAADSCQTCNNFEDQVVTLAENSHRYSGPVFEIDDTQVIRYPDQSLVTLDLQQLAVEVLDANDEVVESAEAASGTFVFELSRTDEGWAIDRIAMGEGP